MIKKIILYTVIFTVLILCFFSQEAFSQVKGYGFKGGVTFSYFYDNSLRSYYNLDIGTGSEVGFNAGIFADIFTKENFVISSELFFNRKSGSADPKINGQSLNYFPKDGMDFHLDYIDYGVPLRYNLTSTKAIPYFYMTPRVCFYLGNDISASGDTVSGSVKDIISEGLNKFGVGFSGGIGIDMKLNKGMSILFEIQFSPDLYDTYYSEDFTVRSNSLEIRTGLKFY